MHFSEFFQSFSFHHSNDFERFLDFRVRMRKVPKLTVISHVKNKFYECLVKEVQFFVEIILGKVCIIGNGKEYVLVK